ncbi:phage tail protein [Paenibacillus odorifer]|nr:phage tail protein [Paenibacillus odorifer]
MAFNHGVTTSERATSVLSTASVSAGIPIVFGTSPVNQSGLTKAPVNTPVLVNSYAEAVNAFGYSDDWGSYSICEFINAYFQLNGLKPAILVNVLDPSVHKTVVAAASKNVVEKSVIIADSGVIHDATLTVKSSDGATPYAKGTDYSVAFDGDGNTVISIKSGGDIPSGVSALSVAYTKLNPSVIDADDIIGGLDAGTGLATGLELVNQVFPRFGLVSGLILAPGYSHNPTVAAVMVAKAGNINSTFTAFALTDMPTDTLKQYTDVPAWKNTNGYTSASQAPLWPKVSKGGKQYYMSTHIACAIGVADASNEGVPVASPSNKSLVIDAAVLADGTEVLLGPDQANFLNSQGIMTVLNFVGGFKVWGNYTGAYPASTDPKDVFISIRRMFIWAKNSIILTYWSQVDNPATPRLIETITDSINIWLNGLTASGYLLGGRVEFNSADNPATDLMAGKFNFQIYITPPGPAQELAFTFEYDAAYLETLFG